jgi:hypothetical protein
MRELHQLLEELCNSFEKKEHNVFPSLLPPLSEQEIELRCKGWFPSKIPKGINNLYTWKGGQEKDAWEEEFPFWFRDMSFISLEQAESEYKSMNESYGVYNTLEEDGVLLKDCFPFAAFNGGWFVVPASKNKWSHKFSEPVICVLQGIEMYYHSIEKMVKTSIECVQHTTWSTEESDLDEKIEMQIWKKYNPGIFEDEF